MKQSQFDAIDTVEINSYLKTRVLPILEPLQTQIMDQRPVNIKSFAYQWLQKLKSNEDAKNQDVDSDDQEPEQVFKQKIKRKKQRQCRSGFRVGVSSESTAEQIEMQKKNTKQKMSMMTFERTQHTKIKILIELRNSILFKNMNHSSLLKVIQKMIPRDYAAGQTVINEGDDGNQLFIVDEGYFKCMIPSKKKQEKVYGPGQAFGQLALLYNTKRASTIIAETDGRLYSLDRLDFNLILRENVLKKAEMCDRILSHIEIFQTLDRSKVYEALQQAEIAAGKYVIRQGQLGDCFYIVAEGKLVAQKYEDGDVKPVYYYKEGDYFGELAIIKNIVRQASVKALTKVRLLYIERSSFKRLLGSIESILRRNQSRYKNSPKRSHKRKISLQYASEENN